MDCSLSSDSAKRPKKDPLPPSINTATPGAFLNLCFAARRALLAARVRNRPLPKLHIGCLSLILVAAFLQSSRAAALLAFLQIAALFFLTLRFTPANLRPPFALRSHYRLKLALAAGISLAAASGIGTAGGLPVGPPSLKSSPLEFASNRLEDRPANLRRCPFPRTGPRNLQAVS